MHKDDFVVCVQQANNGQNFREYKIDDISDSAYCRSRRISIPVYKEYEFLFKNMKNVRRLISIKIDGSHIGDWIIDKGSRSNPTKEVLERFMDSNKRFKVLPVNDDGVDDPTNPENGKIEITVTDETEVKIRTGILRSAYHSEQYSSYYCNVATGEGSVSKQTFKNSNWAGNNGPPLKFIYYISDKCDLNYASGNKIKKIMPKDPWPKDIWPNHPPHTLSGWVCPVCGRGNSPYTSTCQCSRSNEITCIT